MRDVSASRGRCTPGRSTSTISQSPLRCTPRIARRVVCARSETIATFSPTIRFTSVDLPTFGRPARATKPLLVTARSLRRRPQDGALGGKHLTVVGLVVEAHEVQHAVHDRLADVAAALRTDHHVAD